MIYLKKLINLKKNMDYSTQYYFFFKFKKIKTYFNAIKINDSLMIIKWKLDFHKPQLFWIFYYLIWRISFI